MKRIIYYISAFVLSMLSYSCTTDVDDVFDTPASERLNTMLTACREQLLSAPNGWIIEYYPQQNQLYGGHIFIAKFDSDGNVTATGEIADDTNITSHYSLNASNSVTLTFDTYNDILHFFSDPDVKGGTTYGGDFEFTYVSGNSTELIFSGTKTGNTIRFVALDADVDWVEYLTRISGIKEKIVLSPYCNFVWNKGEGDEFVLELEDDNNIFSYVPDKAVPYISRKRAFCYTPTGVKLYEPIEIGGTMIQTLNWNEATAQFVSDTAPSVVLSAEKGEGYVPYDFYPGDWKFVYKKGRTKKEVIITENVRNNSYTMTGLAYPVTLGYNKRTGNLSLVKQAVGTYSGYTVYITNLIGTSRLSMAAGSGYNLVYNRDPDNPVLTFENNGVSEGEGLIFLFYADGYYNVGSFPDIVSLQK